MKLFKFPKKGVIMKSVLLYTVLFLGLNSFAAGGSISNGPVGKEYLNCSGSIAGQAATIRILVVYGKGLTLRAFIAGQNPTENPVIENAYDPSGTRYNGSPYSILIPSMQGYNQPGTYKAMLFKDNQMLSSLTCHQ